MKFEIKKNSDYYDVSFQDGNTKIDKGGLLDEVELLELQKNNIAELLYYNSDGIFKFLVEEYRQEIDSTIEELNEKNNNRK